MDRPRRGPCRTGGGSLSGELLVLATPILGAQLSRDQVARIEAVDGVRVARIAAACFLSRFAKKFDCRLGCRDCHYCDDWVETAVRFEGDALAYSGRITRTLERYEQGAFRHRSGF